MRVLSFKFLVLSLLLASVAQGIDSTATGDWSAGGTWVGGVPPANTDTADIKTGHNVNFNVDQSGFAAGITLTVDAGGILSAETAAGTYHLKAQADITNNGEIKAGTSVAIPYPAVADFTIEFNGAFEIQCGNTGVVNLYCLQPTTRFIKLSGDEAAAQTVLSVDTDVTTDIWAAGDTININDIGKTGADSEERVIAGGGIAAGAITITVGLTNPKNTGAYVILCKRNIHITGGSYAVYNCDDSYIAASCNCTRFSYAGDGTEFAGVFYGSTEGFRYGENHTLSGVFSGSIRGTQYGQSHNISSTGLMSGCTYAIDAAYACTIDGIISGCGNSINVCTAIVLNGTIDGCDNVFVRCAGCKILGTISNSDACFQSGSGHTISATFTGNDDDLVNVGSASCYNTLFGASEFNEYNTSYRSTSDYVESFDHDQVVSAFKAWCRGGIVTSQTASPPTGYTIWYEHAAEDTYPTTAQFPCFRQFETTVDPGTCVEVVGQIRMADGEDLTGAGETGPSLQIIDKFADPLVDSTQSPLDEDFAAVIDGTELGWQDVEVIWANAGNAPRTVFVRMIAYSDTGGDTDIDEVWAIADYKDNINSILSVVRPVDTDVAASDTTTSFTLTAGLATADAYNNMTLQIKDEDDADDNWIERSITDWTGGKVVTVDTAFPFTPAVGDKVRITATSYGAASSGTVNANVIQISGDSTAADNLESMYDGTGYIHDKAPSSRDQIAALAGGVTIAQTAESSTVTQGTETNTYTSTQAHDAVDYTVTDSGAGAGIDFYLQFDIGSGATPVEVHLHGYYDEGTGATNSLYIQVYNVNTSSWVTYETLTNTNGHEQHDIGLDTALVSETYKVQIRFLQDTQEAGSDMIIDHCTVNYVNGAVTSAAMADAVWDELSTGHVDAGKAGQQQWTDVDAILADTDEIEQDQTDGGRLDLIWDAIKYKTDLISLVDTVVKDANDANNFTIEDGTDVNDAYWFAAIQVEDADDNLSKEIRWISFYDENSSDPNVWVDEPFSFTPAPNDVVHIMGTTYGGHLYDIMRSLAQTRGVLNVIDQSKSGTGGLDRAGAIRIDAMGDDP